MTPSSKLAASAIALVVVTAGAARSARAIDSCTLTSVSAVVFGGYDALAGTEVDSTGSVTYHCTGTAATITIGIDQGESSTFASRRMMSGTNALSYNLYLDGSHSSVWGDGSGGSSSYQETAVIGQNTTLTIYGRIAGGQNANVGAYSDSLVVTISY